MARWRETKKRKRQQPTSHERDASRIQWSRTFFGGKRVLLLSFGVFQFGRIERFDALAKLLLSFLLSDDCKAQNIRQHHASVQFYFEFFLEKLCAQSYLQDQGGRSSPEFRSASGQLCQRIRRRAANSAASSPDGRLKRRESHVSGCPTMAQSRTNNSNNE